LPLQAAPACDGCRLRGYPYNQASGADEQSLCFQVLRSGTVLYCTVLYCTTVQRTPANQIVRGWCAPHRWGWHPSIQQHHDRRTNDGTAEE